MSKQNPKRYLLTLALAAIASVQAQNLATITGTVSDGTGAILAGVPIEVSNLATGQISRATTTDAGNYTVSQLQVGEYSLVIEASGFKQYVRPSFHLALSQTMREDVLLEVGQSTESITVTADSSLMKTESSQVANNVTLSQLNTLPILTLATSNAGFRDPYAAVKLMPGVRFAPGSYAESIVINGTPVNTLQTRLDGMTINPTSARLMGANNQAQPSVDAIEEISVLTSNFAPEFGTSGGAMVTLTTKSGSNKFHGSVYDYAANEILNASQPYTGLRNRVRQTDWGFTFGGPLRIPKVYDGTKKTFFFWSFEEYREKKTITTGVTTVPTEAYRAGDFTNLLAQENRLLGTNTGNYTDPLGRTIASGAIFDPATDRPVGGTIVRDPFIGNRIPITRFDPVSVKILALVPLPFGVNAAKQAGSNYLAPYPLSRLSRIPSIKIDQNLGSKLRMSFYFQRTATEAPKSPTSADNFSDPITAGPGTLIAGRTVRANFDYTATPLLLLHFGVGWNDIDSENTAQVTDYDSLKELGLKGQTVKRNFPRIVTSSQSDALGGMTVLGFLLQQLVRERRPTANVTATYVTGRHTFKMGAEGRQERYPDTDLSGTNGLFTFLPAQTQQTSLQGVTTNQGFTGFNLASFMLGAFSGATQRQPINARIQKSQYALYAQDTWKVTRKFTLDYGVRWDYGTYASEQYGRYGSFDPKLPNPSAAGRLGARAYESSCKCKFAVNYPYAIGPRLGFAYQIDRKTSIRGGVGVVYNATSTAGGVSVNFANTGAPAFGQAAGTLREGIPADVAALWPTTAPNAGHPIGAIGSAPTYLDGNAGRPARLLQYSVSLQREINHDLVVEAAYVANRGVWWEAGGLVSLNALQVSDLNRYGFNNFTSSTEAALLTGTIANLTPARKATLASRGVLLPYSNYPTNQPVRNSLTRFPQFTGSPVVSGAPLGNTWYDSLQLTVTKRFSRGISFNLNYTASKTLELLSPDDVFNRANGKILNAFERPQLFRITAQYQVPNLKKTGMALFSNSIVSYALSGWGIGAYLSYQSGVALGRPASTSTTPISQFLGRGPGTAQRKVNADGSYMNPWSVDWTDYNGTRHTDPIDINCHCFDPTKTVVLNPLAWQNIPDGQWGAQQQGTWRDLRGPRLPEENANFNRDFRIREGINLNLRVEFTNIFNRTQLPSPSSVGNFAANPTKFSSGPNAGLYSGGFGTINPLAGTAGQRAGSFVGRITF